MNTSGWSAMKDLEEVKVSCYGRSIRKSKTSKANVFPELTTNRTHQEAFGRREGFLLPRHTAEDCHISTETEGGAPR